MNKKLYFSICIGTLCTFFAVWCIILAITLHNVTNKQLENNTSYNQSDNQNNQNDDNLAINLKSRKFLHFLVISENDDVNVYEVYDDGKKIFKSNLNLHTYSMRKSDKKNFEKGIILEKEEDILYLIEDYTS